MEDQVLCVELLLHQLVSALDILNRDLLGLDVERSELILGLKLRLDGVLWGLGEGPLLLIIVVHQRVLLLNVWHHVFLLHLQLQQRLILNGVKVKMLVLLLLLDLLLLAGCEEIFIVLHKVLRLVDCKRLGEGSTI